MITFVEWLKNNNLVLENYQPEHTGILKVRPNPAQLVQMQQRIIEKFPDMKPLPEEKLHITLLHQQLAKPLKKATLPPLQTDLSFDANNIYLIEREGRKSIFVVANEQDAIRNYMNEISKMGVQIEPNRTYHVTLTNLTGNVADSVGHSEQMPIMSGAQKLQI
jgi:hypothetical protein